MTSNRDDYGFESPSQELPPPSWIYLALTDGFFADSLGSALRVQGHDVAVVRPKLETHTFGEASHPRYWEDPRVAFVGIRRDNVQAALYVQAFLHGMGAASQGCRLVQRYVWPDVVVNYLKRNHLDDALGSVRGW